MSIIFYADYVYIFDIVMTMSCLKYKATSVLVPGDPGRLGTPIYIVTLETLPLMEARLATWAGKAHSFT
jgi:hypothetical protein